MPQCPVGHESQDTDYCDECGRPIGGVSAGSAPVPAVPAPANSGGAPCAYCGYVLEPGARFCEGCGRAVEPAAVVVPPVVETPADPPVPPPPAEKPGTWTVTVCADPKYFTWVQEQSGPDGRKMHFPPYHTPRTVPFPADKENLLVGRVSKNSARPAAVPDIDLSDAPADPGVSHTHAVLLHRPDGGLAVADLGSRNGTYLNYGEEAVEVNIPFPLQDGDKVHLGAWTTLEIHRVTE
jgi:hypothetical protein